MVNWPQGGWKPSSLCPGDVIISLGDRPLSAPVDLINGLNRIPLGTTVAITGIDAVTNPDTPFAGRIRP
jgi:S1-C subfamily serine protease